VFEMDTDARDYFNFLKKKFKITAKSLHDVLDRYYDGFEDIAEDEIPTAVDKFESESFGYYLLPDGEIKRK